MLPAVILAAGQGHRLLESSGGVPKPLIPVLGVPLLERTLLSCRAAGITEVFVVVGYRQELLQPAIAAWARRYDMALHVVQNPVWVEGNGTSALAVAPYLGQAFFLLMCDHVFTPAMLGELLAAEDGTEVCRLAVDRRIEAIFDLPDATKVRLDGPMITAIGKDIVPFDAIDTGLFLCRPFLFNALERARAAGDSSLSGGMRQLLTTGQLRAVDIGTHFWSDVDTPASLAYTERALMARLEPLRHCRTTPQPSLICSRQTRSWAILLRIVGRVPCSRVTWNPWLCCAGPLSISNSVVKLPVPSWHAS